VSAPASNASPGWSVAVVIPALNEETAIRPCIESVLESSLLVEHLSALWIVVVADACTDRTACRARATLGSCGEVLECHARSPGTARQLGVAKALRHFESTDYSRLWIANTDADSCVPPDWLDHHLHLAEQGIAAIAGIVRVENVPGYGTEMAQRLLADYEVAADGTHSHVHGANLGVRADAYLDAGGWSQLTVAEDHCLWGRIRQRGWRLSSCAQSVVVTSGRLVGRARGGFADTLRAKAECIGV
jgi:cellulose synthase/poly-beta-1,6-N-acetylglucosamine synthase-like glycosyltransferase